jgi:hypothetical protein
VFVKMPRLDFGTNQDPDVIRKRLKHLTEKFKGEAENGSRLTNVATASWTPWTSSACLATGDHTAQEPGDRSAKLFVNFSNAGRACGRRFHFVTNDRRAQSCVNFID